VGDPYNDREKRDFGIGIRMKGPHNAEREVYEDREKRIPENA